MQTARCVCYMAMVASLMGCGGGSSAPASYGYQPPAMGSARTYAVTDGAAGGRPPYTSFGPPETYTETGSVVDVESVTYSYDAGYLLTAHALLSETRELQSQ